MKEILERTLVSNGLLTAFALVGGFPDIPLMEDIVISHRLKRLTRPLCLSARAVTSGTAAIHAAVAAVDPEPGDEIITSARHGRSGYRTSASAAIEPPIELPMMTGRSRSSARLSAR